MKRRSLVQSNTNRRPAAPEHPRSAAHPTDVDGSAGTRRAKPEAARHHAMVPGPKPELEPWVLGEEPATAGQPTAHD